ncbi:hypothetical protein [Paenarthrobacter nitroguajacolicus]|uniref:hypothetical protein n=1 Tax=Paenarthrobacter nitroguajacolicus TaxID=211146 RepID=UPI002856831E|nr:hypothetical protein [Paenarthrobacter nitroguajacolicus]MDR6638301.1 hypothetical protein [Paenarthrobacter nitroguajacolicus]
MFPRAASILRSVMVAGAGTAIWMALSATAANADSGPQNSHSLLIDVSSTVASVTATVKSAPAPPLSVPVPSVPVPAPVKGALPATPIAVPVPALPPIVHQAGASVDAIVGTAPVVSHIVPADTTGDAVGTVIVPVTGVIDDSVRAVVTPVNDAIAPLRLEPVTDVTTPILEPIVGVADTLLPPVGTVPEPSAPALPPLSGADSTLPPVLGVTAPPAPVIPTGSVSPATDALQGFDVVLSKAESTASVPAIATTVSITHILSSRGTVPVTKGHQSAVLPDPPADTLPDLEAVPAGVGGSGSSNSQNGPPSPAAVFLHDATIVPVGALPGLSAAGDEQHPEPVCFDPGSSPD